MRRELSLPFAFMLLAGLCPPLFPAEAIRALRTIDVARDEFMVDAGGKWSAPLPEVKVEAGQRILLALEARTDTEGYGGCNFVLQASINSRPINQPREWPRLLNKPPAYHLRNFEPTCHWYRASNHGWSTVFGPGFEEKSVVEGQDFRFAWDVTELILPGQPNTLTIAHLQPRMPEWTKGRGKLALRNVALQIADAGQVKAVAQALLKQDTQPPQIAPAVNELRSNKVGERPYELVWANRKDLPPPLVTFDDLSDWEVAQYDGATATLERSREEQIWGDYVGKLTFHLPEATTAIVLRPRKPIPIPSEFDCVNLWLNGGKDYFLKGGSQVPTVFIQIEDANGETHELNIGKVNQNYWFLQHGKFAPFRWRGEFGWPTYESWGGDGNARIEFPAKFRAIVLSDCKRDGDLTLWLDSLAFYREHRTQPDLPPPPAEPVYPTTPDTILPTVAAEHKTAIVLHEGRHELRTDGPGIRLRYIVHPQTGTLSDVTLPWADGEPIVPMDGGGIVYGDALAPARAKLVSMQMAPGALKTSWQLTDATGAHDYDINYSIKGKTLIIDIEAKDDAATAFVFGTAKDLTKPKLIDVPYLSIEPTLGPRVLYTRGLFMLGLLDWYNTNASTFDGTAKAISDTEAAFNGGSTYLPRTDGRRNPLRERVFLTVSPDFHEVLPNIPNPPSPRLAWASKYIYNMINPPLQPGFLRLLSLYGVDHQFAICWGRIWITRQGDSYTYRVRPRPELTYEDVAEYAKTVRSYGHVFGLGGGGRDFCPLSKRWDEDLVALEPDGNWRPGWPSNYVIDHIAARRLAREAGSEARQRYGPSVFYFDVGTQPSPWRCANDFSALIPGAGMLRNAFRWNCDLMLEFRKHHDFIVSEGGHRWMYAGLSEGDYATLPSSTPKYKLPLLVDFDLLKIHPLQHGVGMGYGITAFYPQGSDGRLTDEARKDWTRDGISRYVAATIAYGHMGCLSGCLGWPPSWTMRYFALIWPVQQEYLTDTVAEIRYHDGEKFVSPSEAVATDAYRKGRVHVRYARGLDVVVNYSESENWQVRVGDRDYLLPPFGFVAHLPGKLFEGVVLKDGRQVDYVESPELLYAQSSTPIVDKPILTADGAAMMRRRDDAAWWLIPCSGLAGYKWEKGEKPPFFPDVTDVKIKDDEFCREVRIDLGRLFPGAAPDAVKVFRCGDDGKPGEEVKADRDGSILIVKPSADVRRYLIEKATP